MINLNRRPIKSNDTSEWSYTIDTHRTVLL